MRIAVCPWDAPPEPAAWLLTIHGDARWSDAETIRVQRAIEAFLRKHHVLEGAAQ